MRQLVRAGTLLALLVVTFAFVACGDDDDDGSQLSDGVLATFEVNGQQFKAWITNPETIDQVLALRDGTSMANIPNGVLREGPGEGGHNAPWNWHLDPEEIAMAEITIEVCDGEPSYVEEHLDEFIETVGSYCPWSAELIGVEDLR
jgi:hypothetical protein